MRKKRIRCLSMNTDRRKPGVCDLSLLATSEPSSPTLTHAVMPEAAEDIYNSNSDAVNRRYIYSI